MKQVSRTITGLAAIAFMAMCQAQSWAEAYDKGLADLKAQKWADARTDFISAVALRGEDQSEPTRLPGSITERRVWRNGSPYSPNFAAAYAGFKDAMAMTDETAKSTLLSQVTSEFEMLLTKNQHSPETYYFLAMAYANMRDVAKQQDLEARFKLRQGNFSWKIDSEVISPEEKTAMTAVSGTSPSGQSPLGVSPISPAAKLPDKFALLIGNSESRVPDGGIPYAGNDVSSLRESLIQYAGYEEKNVDILANATAAQMNAAAKALVERVTPDGTIFLYFTGIGANLDGKDYLAGVDTSRLTDSSTMLAKSELYQMFVKKGCKIYAFYQVARPVIAGFYFGKEEPRIGQISQTQSTMPGGTITGVVRNGQNVGLFTDAMCNVIREFRSNNIPIHEFGWQVFNWMRGARSPAGASSGGAQQMTLPVVINMDPERSGF